MSAATLIRSPADCINAVLANMEMEAQFTERYIKSTKRHADEAMSARKSSLASEYDIIVNAQQALLRQNREQQQLIRTECAAFLAVHAEMVLAGGA